MSAHLVRVAWQRTLAALIVNLVGMPIDMVIGRSISGVLFWPSICSMAISGVLLLMHVQLRRRASVPLAATIFLLNNVGIVSALWVTSGYYAQGLASWMPFQANKLGALIVAVIAPQLLAGLLSIGLFVGTALARVWTLSSVASLAPLLAIEVWTLLVFGIFGAVLLVYRIRSDRLRDDLVDTQAKSQAFNAFAQRLLAISDLANTPLQILELNVPLLKDDKPGESLLRVERAVGTLRRWHRILDREAAQLTWTSEAESFDAQTVLRETVGPSRQ